MSLSCFHTTSNQNGQVCLTADTVRIYLRPGYVATPSFKASFAEETRHTTHIAGGTVDPPIRPRIAFPVYFKLG